MSFTPLLTATLIFISSFLQAGDFILLPEGKKMEAEDWDAPDEPKVEDSLASGGKAVLLRRDGGALTKTLKLERSHYALSIWARCSEETYLLPAYLELSVGSKTYRMRTRYNIDRNVYLAGYLDSFGIHKHQGYEETETFSRAKGYHRYSFKKGVPWWGENTRFYFPVDAAGDVKLQLRMGARSKVDLLIDRLQLRDVLAHLPQGARKKHRAFFSADEEKAWERLKLRDSAAKQFAADTAQRGYQGQNWSDDTCWDYVPSPYMPRSQQAGPCPVHGNEVFRRGGYANPWKGEPRAFHVRCFVGNEAYPSNAIEKGDLTSGKYPDDGWGYVHTDAKSPFPKDQEMLFVGRRVYNRWQSIPNHVMELARRWVITRSTEAAHQAGVFLAAIAYHYPGYDYRFQSRRTLIGHGKGTWVGEPPRETDQGWTVAFNDWGCGKIFYCGWTGGPNNEIKIMLAYDLLFPFLMKDEGLLRFVGSRIPWIKTFEDLQELLDRHLLAVHSDALIRRQAKSANSGWESSAAVMSVIQDGPEAQRILKELSSRANLDGTNAGGFEDAVVNMLCRDGVGLICSPMYCFGWSRGLIAAGHLSRVGDPELRKRYGMTGPKLASRISAMCRLARGLRIAGSFLPNLGDNNRANKGEGDHFIRELWPLFLNEWKDRRDPRYAALVKRFASPQDLLLKHAEYITDLTEAAERGEPALSSASRAFGGYGAVILERPSSDDSKKGGGVFLFYGPGWGHDNAGALNLELFARGARVLPDKGRHHGSTKYHNVVEVDGVSQRDWSKGSNFGWLNHFASAPGIRFTDIAARPHRYEHLNRYRRAVAYIDAGEGDGYVFDVFQADGGKQHVFALHGPPSSAVSSSLPMGEPGEFAVAYFKEGKFKNPRQAPDRISGPVTLDWKFLNGTPEYRENPQETEIHMQARVWGAEDGTLTSAEVVGDIPFNITGFHFAKRAENAMKSGFLTLMSPYEKQPFVISATRLLVSGLDAYSGHALKVELSSGRHDVIAYHGSAGQKPDTQLAVVPTDTVKAGDDFSLKGVFGFVSRRKDGSLRQVFMTGGKLIRSKDFVLEVERAEYVGTVRGVDRESQWIHLTEPVLPGSEVVGSIAVIGSATRSRVYNIKRVSPDGRSLQVEGSLLLYQSKVSGVNHAKGEIGVQFLPPFLRCDPKFYDGCVAANESHSLMWKVKGISKETVGAILQVGPATEGSDQFKSPLNLHADSFTDADGDGRALVYMYEIAPGDTMKITTHVSVTRNENGQTQVDANVPYRLSVPPKK